MKLHTTNSLLVLVVAVGALFLLDVALDAGEPAPVLASGADAAPSRIDTTIRAEPRISIPFGINPELSVYGRGRVVEVIGHGQCPNEGEVDVSVFVTSHAGNARALGSRTWSCPRGENWEWTVNADALGPWNFSRSQASVCAVSVVRSDGEARTVVENWCKDKVDLTGSPYIAQPLAEP